MSDNQLVLHLPQLRPLGLRILRSLLETVIVPAAIYSILLSHFDLRVALAGSLVWVYAMMLIRIVREGRVPAVLILAAFAVTTRTAVAMAADSQFVYLIQPIVASVIIGLGFIFTALRGQPIIKRLVGDYWTVPSHVVGLAAVERMFYNVTLVWGASRIVSAGLGYMMINGSPTTIMLARSVVSPSVTTLTVAASVFLGYQAMKAEGVKIRRYCPVAAAA